MPIYEGLLAAANASERDIILAAGPRQVLDDNLVFCNGPERDRAIAAADAIKSILNRITGGIELCVTGIDPRGIPPRREVLDPSLIQHGRLLWEGRDGFLSKLLLHYLNPVIHITDLRIEPTGHSAEPSQPVMPRSASLLPLERIDDTSRLRRMQELIDQGNPPKTSARKALAEEPYPYAEEESSVTRLVRKFNERVKQTPPQSGGTET